MNGLTLFLWRTAVSISLGLVVSLFTGCRSTNDAATKARAMQPSIAEKWGVEIASVRLSAGGQIVDFRYRVLDPEKASPLMSRQIKPYLIDQASHARFGVSDAPKVGALRQTTLKLTPGRIYFILFANVGQVIHQGSKVTAVVGEFRAENLTVE